MDFVVFVMDDLLVERRAEGFAGQLLYWVPPVVLQRIEARPFTRDAVVTCLGYYPNTRGHFVERSKGLDEYVLIFVENGEGWIDTGGRREDVAAGNVILLLHDSDTPMARMTGIHGPCIGFTFVGKSLRSF